ncbi:hypothetical protein B0F90DRAFT_1677212, partial [Multifurca ochricompacta]
IILFSSAAAQNVWQVTVGDATGSVVYSPNNIVSQSLPALAGTMEPDSALLRPRQLEILSSLRSIPKITPSPNRPLLIPARKRLADLTRDSTQWRPELPMIYQLSTSLSMMYAFTDFWHSLDWCLLTGWLILDKSYLGVLPSGRVYCGKPLRQRNGFLRQCWG